MQGFEGGEAGRVEGGGVGGAVEERVGGVGGEGEGAEVVDAEVVEGGVRERVVGGHCVRCGTMLWLHCGGGCGGPSSPTRRIFHRPNLPVNILPIVYSSLSRVRILYSGLRAGFQIGMYRD